MEINEIQKLIASIPANAPSNPLPAAADVAQSFESVLEQAANKLQSDPTKMVSGPGLTPRDFQEKRMEIVQEINTKMSSGEHLTGAHSAYDKVNEAARLVAQRIDELVARFDAAPVESDIASRIKPGRFAKHQEPSLAPKEIIALPPESKSPMPERMIPQPIENHSNLTPVELPHQTVSNPVVKEDEGGVWFGGSPDAINLIFAPSGVAPAFTPNYTQGLFNSIDLVRQNIGPSNPVQKPTPSAPAPLAPDKPSIPMSPPIASPGSPVNTGSQAVNTAGNNNQTQFKAGTVFHK